MLTTYKALLRGNQLEWLEEVPMEIADGSSVPVHITILTSAADATATEPRGERMAAVLNRLARHHDEASIADPLAWERATRADRALPRDEA